MSKYTEKDLQDFAVCAAIWDEMSALAVTTGTPGDGRQKAYKDVANTFRVNFDRIAKEMNATPKQIAKINAFVERYKVVARRNFAEMATQN